MASKNGELGRFVALFSLVFVGQYPITGREIGSLTLLFFCVIFVWKVWLPSRVAERHPRK